MRIVEAWHKSGNLSRIERDIALEDLRALYNEIADLKVDASIASAPVEAVVTPVVAATPAVEQATQAVEQVAEVAPKVESVEFDDDLLDIDALLGLTPSVDSPSVIEPEPTPESIGEVVAESEPATELIPEPVVVAEPTPVVEPEPVVEPVTQPESTPAFTPEPQPESEEATLLPMSDGKLFAEEDIPVSKRSERKIVSLYTATGATVATSTTASALSTTASAVEGVAHVAEEAPKVAPKVIAPAEQQPKRLVDVLGGGKRVLADEAVKDDVATTPFNRISDLRKAIGINDKFLMIKDLFGGNADLYNTTIDRLNAFDDLDDCMIYIAENFAWNPDSVGAKLLVSLIERKLG